MQVANLISGAPKDGLYLREDIDLRCNFLTTSFVKKNLKRAHGTLVARLVEMARVYEGRVHNERLAGGSEVSASPASPSLQQGQSGYQGEAFARSASVSKASAWGSSPIAHHAALTNILASSQSTRPDVLPGPYSRTSSSQPGSPVETFATKDSDSPWDPHSFGAQAYTQVPASHELDGEQHTHVAELE